ncbi:hypothetical protein TWF788_008253 [Orbilia oligospora]|uniref:Protein kinase domain-containing protein n=1 Tax=Orbilia oligospora TaxID=2813651 RepID=A0A7C8Q376_ORBOL|nr:hypothetical protein TWF788_008253 [Orbilia oligospora]
MAHSPVTCSAEDFQTPLDANKLSSLLSLHEQHELSDAEVHEIRRNIIKTLQATRIPQHHFEDFKAEEELKLKAQRELESREKPTRKPARGQKSRPAKSQKKNTGGRKSTKRNQVEQGRVSKPSTHRYNLRPRPTKPQSIGQAPQKQESERNFGSIKDGFAAQDPDLFPFSNNENPTEPKTDSGGARDLSINLIHPRNEEFIRSRWSKSRSGSSSAPVLESIILLSIDETPPKNKKLGWLFGYGVDADVRLGNDSQGDNSKKGIHFAIDFNRSTGVPLVRNHSREGTYVYEVRGEDEVATKQEEEIGLRLRELRGDAPHTLSLSSLTRIAIKDGTLLVRTPLRSLEEDHQYQARLSRFLSSSFEGYLTPLTPTSQDTTVLSQYLIQDPIKQITPNRKSSGDTYVAIHKITGQSYTAKYYRRSSSAKDSPWHTEMQFLCDLRHKTIIEFGGLIETDREVYLLTPAPQRGCLSQHSLGAWEHETKISAVYQILDAVSFVHEYGAAHLAIQPSSFLVVKEKPLSLKLSDFGRATRQRLSRATGTGASCFAAPETRPKPAVSSEVQPVITGLLVVQPDARLNATHCNMICKTEESGMLDSPLSGHQVGQLISFALKNEGHDSLPSTRATTESINGTPPPRSSDMQSQSFLCGPPSSHLGASDAGDSVQEQFHDFPSFPGTPKSPSHSPFSPHENAPQVLAETSYLSSETPGWAARPDSEDSDRTTRLPDSSLRLVTSMPHAGFISVPAKNGNKGGNKDNSFDSPLLASNLSSNSFHSILEGHVGNRFFTASESFHSLLAENGDNQFLATSKPFGSMLADDGDGQSLTSCQGFNSMSVEGGYSQSPLTPENFNSTSVKASAGQSPPASESFNSMLANSGEGQSFAASDGFNSMLSEGGKGGFNRSSPSAAVRKVQNEPLSDVEVKASCQRSSDGTEAGVGLRCVRSSLKSGEESSVAPDCFSEGDYGTPTGDIDGSESKASAIHDGSELRETCSSPWAPTSRFSKSREEDLLQSDSQRCTEVSKIEQDDLVDGLSLIRSKPTEESMKAVPRPQRHRPQPRRRRPQSNTKGKSRRATQRGGHMSRPAGATDAKVMSGLVGQNSPKQNRPILNPSRVPEGSSQPFESCTWFIDLRAIRGPKGEALRCQQVL